jgi:hypothetical protein
MKRIASKLGPVASRSDSEEMDGRAADEPFCERLGLSSNINGTAAYDHNIDLLVSRLPEFFLL